MWRGAEHHARVLGALLLTLLARPASARQEEPSRADDPRPNIVLVMVDDAGWGDLGCYGSAHIRTPNLDRMAAEGLRFTDFYAGGTVCVPSRACLLTGKHSGHTAVRLNGPFPLPAEETTVAEVLRPLGYRTACIGKWGLGRNARNGGDPLEHGFDEFFGFIDQTDAHRHYPRVLFRDGKRELYEGNPTRQEHYAHDLFTAEALAFVERNRERPFFLYVPYTLPHADLDVPADSLEPYLGQLGEEQPYVEHLGPGVERLYKDQPTPRAAYAGMLGRVDRDMGRLLETLRALELDEHTLVLFTSDNGPSSVGGTDPEFFQSAGPFRGGKRFLYEGGLRVPLIARWPGHVPAGAVSALPCASWDLLATAAALAGGQAPEASDGVDLSPTLLGRPGDQVAHEYLYWESTDPEVGPLQAVRSGRWKLLRSWTGDEPEVELYDLQADPGEGTDLAGAQPERVAELQALMARAHEPHPLAPILPGEEGPRRGPPIQRRRQR